MPQDLLDRPVAPPKPSPPGPGQADGNPRMNARGQFRGPAPQHEPEVVEALKRRIAKDTADIARREAIEEADGEVSAGTAGGVDEIPIAGWIVLGAEIGVAGYQAYQIYQDTKDLAKAIEELKQAESGGGGNKDNVQVLGDDPCDLKPFNQNKCPAGRKHHVVADYVLRYGTRLQSNMRIPNAPSLNEGLTICLSPSEHTAVHAIMDKAVAQLGGAAGTAPMNQIVETAIDALEKVKPECKGQLEDVRKQFEHMGDQQGRTTKSLPKSSATQTLQSGGAGGSTR